MLTKAVIRVSKTVVKDKYENYRLKIPRRWEKHFEIDDIVLIRFNLLTMALRVTREYKVTIPVTMMEYYEINTTIWTLATLDTKSKMITLTLFEKGELE